tara:strand:- start:1077 stop:1688 length:612 start_codon:yes stop_codon:yes gene_type:complete
MLIVIIGPDGCGKTTIANELCNILSKRNITTHHLAMNFEILPKLGDITNFLTNSKPKERHKEGEMYVGMKDMPNSTLKGMIISTWYSLDYFFGRYKLLKWKSDVVIFARYFYDYSYQRVHINTPKWYLKILEILIPKPDFIFTLDRDAKNIFELKPELSVREIERQQSEICILLKNKSNSHIIDGNEGIVETLNKILRIIDRR